ncbi:MAG TPA: efflux RND transporter periplasmic adaptor subunit [Longimicrobium sp.]|uniref:efflux RND transporter periplasmic adaptor subunit n=1 Tax=Longimicrobium sp. TaxID=2029185 RepID=UPI002ED85C9A
MNVLRIAAPLLLTAAAACGAEARGEAAPDPAVAIRTAPVTEEWGTLPVTGTGTLADKEEVALSFKTGGIVASVLAEEGQRVRRGQTLATLDAGEIDALVRRAEQGAAKAERDLARARSLYADSVVTLEQMQDAATAAGVARAELAAVRFNRRHAAIVAPASGTILRRAAEAGEMVPPGAPVLVLGAAGRGTVLRVGLPDRDAVRLRRGDAATVAFDAYPGVSFAGRVSEVAAAASPGTGTYEVEVAVDAGGRALASGLIGRVQIAPAARERLRMVPVEALLEADDDSATVFTLAPDGRARRMPVRIAFLRGERAAVRGGLDGVAEVVTDGAAYLEDGAAVRRAVAP